MKVQFSREVKYIPQWNNNDQLPENEQVVAILKPLKMGHLLDLMDGLQKVQAEGINPQTLTAEQAGKNVGKLRDLVDSAGHLLPEYVEIQNLEDSSGPVTSGNLLEFPYYMELASELLAELANISMPSEEEAKN